jgi:hypothetical protein
VFLAKGYGLAQVRPDLRFVLSLECVGTEFDRNRPPKAILGQALQQRRQGQEATLRESMFPTIVIRQVNVDDPSL